MRQTIILLTLLLFILTPVFSQKWSVLNEGFEGWPDDMCFINESTGWIAAGRTLYKTEDAGETWYPVPVQEEYKIWRVDFVNDSVGWSIDSYSENKILKSEDGGLTWMVCLEDNFYFGTLYVVNDSVVYLVGNDDDENGKIYKTEDGGQSWFDRSPNFTNREAYSVCFYNETTGVITGEYDDGNTRPDFILGTRDGGQSWQELINTEFGYITDVQFINDSTAYFILGTFLCKTTDFFNTWQVKTKSDHGIDSYFVKDDGSIFAVIRNSLYSKVMKSTDDGATWNSKQSVIGGKIFFSSDNTGFVLSTAGRYINPIPVLYKSIDKGESWRLDKLGGGWFSDVFFLDHNNGFICLGYPGRHSIPGYFFCTHDGGQSWQLDISTNAYYESCDFPDKQTGFRLTKRTIEKTNDAGENWYNVYPNDQDSSGFNFAGNDFAFQNNQRGLAAGWVWWLDSLSGAALLGTYDSGETWDLVWYYPDSAESNYSLSSIYSVNNTTWAVGSNGLIVKSVNMDSFRVIDAGTDLPLNDVFFSDENHGWITGGYHNNQGFQSIILETNNAGHNWYKIPFDKYLINDMYFAKSLHGWAVGRDTTSQGMILETFYGREDWNPVVENLSAPLNAIHFVDSVGWAVGDNGLILTTDDRSTWINQNTGDVYPSKCKLFQNYPNPFNPKTVISYALPVTSHLDLSIYNILGQKVATLVNKKQRAGSYQVQWNASGFATGIYYYRIEAGDFQQVKKMVLIK